MDTFHKSELLIAADFIEEITTRIDQGDMSVSTSSTNENLRTQLPDCIIDGMAHLMTAIRRQGQRNAIASIHSERSVALQRLMLDIASLAPLQQTLNHVCDTVRLTLGTEISYIQMYNEREQASIIQAISGTSPNFLGVKQRLGHGIGGRVVLYQRPLIFSDYPRDNRRDPDVERAVDEEGIISAAGTPLFIESKVIGVLFAATRERYEFAKEDMELLETIARLASVAIANAKLYDRSQRIMVIYQKLGEAVLNEGAIEAVIHSLSDILGGNVWLLDSGRKVVGQSIQQAAIHVFSAIPALEENGIHTKTDDNIVRIEHENKTYEMLLAPLIVGNSQYGLLIASGLPGYSFDDIDQIAVDRCKTLLSLAISNQQVKHLSELHLRSTLFHSLLFKSEERVVLQERAKHLGINLSNRHYLIMTTCIDPVVLADRQESIHRLLRSVESSFDFSQIPLSHVEGTTLISVSENDKNLYRIAKKQHDIIANELLDVKIVTVMSEACTLPEDYQREFKRCQNAVSWHRQFNQVDSIIRAETFGLAGLLFDASNLEPIRVFCSNTLGPIVSYDSDHGTNLKQTIQTYLAHESEIRATATHLNVHYNTLRYRLERIEEILQKELSDPDFRQQLRLALLLNDAFHIV